MTSNDSTQDALRLERRNMVERLHSQGIDDEYTVGHPYYIARACELADVAEHERVLVVGPGVGFQAAVLARLCRDVVQLELIDSMAAPKARAACTRLAAAEAVITVTGKHHGRRRRQRSLLELPGSQSRRG
jgi:protein-L-isoaspartate O-methyltransferase